MAVAVLFALGLFSGVTVTVLAAFQLDRYAHSEIDDPCLAAAVLDQLLDPLVEMSAIDEDHVGVRECRDIGGSGFVIVRIGIRLEELGHLDFIAPYLTDDVCDLGRSRDDRHGLAGAAF